MEGWGMGRGRGALKGWSPVLCKGTRVNSVTLQRAGEHRKTETLGFHLFINGIGCVRQ